MSEGKLVRDKIPQIIRSKGLEPVIYGAGTEEFGNTVAGQAPGRGGGVHRLRQ